MTQRLYTAIAALALLVNATAQPVSALREQKELFASYSFTREEEWDNLRKEGKHVLPVGGISTAAIQKAAACSLTKRVYGWHPYWNGSTYTSYQWNLLSDFCYFDYTVNASTGNNSNASFAWSTSAAVTAAINNGVNAHFCATLFSNHATFLASAAAQQTFITNTINLLNSRGGKGVNIDFEGMAASNKTAFTAFMQNLSTQLKAANASYEVSVALYAVDWSAVFDIPNLTNYVDLFIIMGYDYYWSGSATAGPDAPLYNFDPGYNYTLTKSVTYYLKQGVPAGKLLLGLPYYGREWSTNGSTIPSATTGAYSASKTFAAVKGAPSTYSSSTYNWEGNSFSPVYIRYTGTEWRQCWIDDARSMRYRFKMVNERGIGGIGIWALGYDDGYTDFWDAIEDKFSDCAAVACTDTIYDMGGPNRNYYDNEDYTYTIAPTGANQVSLTFSAFNTELNYDSLWLYDGTSASAPLIGQYTGTSGPGTVNSTGNAITVRFKSDGSTVNSGFSAIWNCTVDNVAPTTQVNVPATWITQTFTATYTDADNGGGSGIEKRFYNVAANTGTEWRSNPGRGFFYDNFNAAIHPEWTSKTGTWGIVSGHLGQTDQTLSNTNIYAPLTQNLSNRYLYHWQGMISGTGTNRRAGLHFFCDQPDSSNRGNNYFVWFRADQDAIEFYKVTNNVFTLVHSIPQTINTGVFYDKKVSYDRITGQISVWLNNVYAGSWTDSSPISNGSYVSFRSGNCDYAIEDFVVYRSRTTSTSVTVGSAPANDLRYQNQTPSQPAGQISSLVKDSAYNLSAVASQTMNIDWSTPYCPAAVADGASSDVDTVYTTTQLTANWSGAIDTNSALAYYEYAIGTSPGLQDVVPFTGNGAAVTVTHTGLSLMSGQQYFFTIRAYNGAGLVCSGTASDGVIVQPASGILHTGRSGSVLYPNPNNGSFALHTLATEEIDIEITDLSGRIVSRQTLVPVKGVLLVQTDLASGTFLLKVLGGATDEQHKLIIAR